MLYVYRNIPQYKENAIIIYYLNMTEKKEEKKPATTDNKKPKVSQTDKYYKIKADFGYLSAYNYKITKEIGRGGYGVVYKVILSLK